MADVSVVVPVLNGETYIEACVASSLDQGGVDVEVIVVDDGSSDRTCDLVRGMAAADPRVRLVPRGSCGGPGAARNTGIDEAGSPLVTFIDADDQFLPFALATMRGLLEASGADIVYGRLGWLDGLGRLRPVAYLDSLVSPGRNLRDDPAVAGGFGVVEAKLFRKDFLDSHGLRFPGLFGGEDTVFSLQSWYEARSILSTEGIVLVRRPVARPAGDSSLTEERSPRMRRDLIACAALIDGFCLSHGLDPLRRTLVPIVLSKVLRQVSEIREEADRIGAYAEFMEAVGRTDVAEEDIERELGFSKAELECLDPTGLSESEVRYRRVRTVLLKALADAREKAGLT